MGFGKIIARRKFHSLVKTSWAVRPRAASSASINSRTAPLPPGALAIKFARANTTEAAVAGAADRPAIAIAGRSLTSSPMKQISVSFTPAAAANSRSAAALSRHPLTTCRMSIFSAERSTNGLFSPEIRAKISPARRASDTPMMSAKQKRFHSSPPGPHQSPPSLSTPSTSMATARIFSSATAAEFSWTMQLDHGAHAAEFLDDRELALIDAFDPIAFCLLPEPDVAYEPRDAVWLQGGGMIRTPHGAIHRDVALHRTGAQCSGADAGRNSGLMSRVANGHAVSCGHRRYRAQIQFVVGCGVRTRGVH